MNICDFTTEELINELKKRGRDVQPLIEHHTKYLEIDGYDETILVTHKEHREIHRRMREQGIKIPNWICEAAKGRASSKRRKGTEYNKKLHESSPILYERMYKKKLKYHKEVIQQIRFDSTPTPNVVLCELIRYNKNTKSISISSYFTGRHIKLLSVNI